MILEQCEVLKWGVRGSKNLRNHLDQILFHQPSSLEQDSVADHWEQEEEEEVNGLVYSQL